MRIGLVVAAALALFAQAALAQDTFVVAPKTVADEKAVFATVESANVVPARARIGGTVVELAVKEGDGVKQGQVVATIGDEKLALQMKSLDAQIAGLEAQFAQAQTDLTRAEDLFSRGTIPKTRLDEARTAFNVASNALKARTAERSVLQQQVTEGKVLAPASGRVLKVPLTAGSVILAGETVATVAEQNYILRLRVPERHARFLKAGDPVRIDGEEFGKSGAQFGTIRLVYPQIEDGRVVADAALAVGLIALLTIAREEEPQISVPMVDIRVNAEGLKAPDAVELVTKPLEAIIKGIDGVEHVYSQTLDDRVMVTARFLVGTKSDDAILRVHEKIRANIDRIPVGIPEPLIVGRGINDVAIVVLTLSPRPEAAAHWTDKDLYELADQLRSELVKTDNVGLTYISGGNPEQIRVEPDPSKLALFGVTLQQLVAKVRDANRSFQAGSVRDNDTMRNVAAGQTLAGIPDIGLLLVATRDNRPVYVRDVASVVIGPSPQEHRVWLDVAGKSGHWDRVPGVSVAFAKRAGANAVVERL